MQRRKFLVLTALGGAGLLSRFSWAEPGEAGAGLAPAVLDALGAITSRILPSSDGPGAREANVLRFLESQLHAPDLAPLSQLLKATVQTVDRAATRQFGSAFAATRPDQQDLILGALSRGELTAPGFPQREAFRLLHSLTLEGFLSDPKHGGNANRIGWRTIGFQGGSHSH